MEEVDASDQLQRDLNDSVRRALKTSRPVLTHVNQDTTWLLSLACPSKTGHSQGRSRFNILIDPWLAGPQSDVAAWFSTQWHAVQSSVQTIAELNNILHETELLAAGPSKRAKVSQRRGGSYVDAVICSHEFTDHCHKATLLEVEPYVPVYATKKAADLIRSWAHFEQIFDLTLFTRGIDWRTTSTGTLPPWLGISRLVTRADAFYYHSAKVLCFENPSAEDEQAEAVIYTPHGVEAQSLSTITTCDPPIQILALLHGLHDVSIGLSKQLNLGASNALKAQRLLNSKYWVGTHDEVKIGTGMIAPLLRRKVLSVEDALKSEKSKNSSEPKGDQSGLSRDISYIELGSGDALLLE